MREPSPIPMLRMREENFSGDGSICGQPALGIRHLVDVEKDRAGNMFGEIFLMGIPVFGRHTPRGIDDDQVGRIELAGKLIVSVNHVFVCNKAKSPIPD